MKIFAGEEGDYFVFHNINFELPVEIEGVTFVDASAKSGHRCKFINNLKIELRSYMANEWKDDFDDEVKVRVLEVTSPKDSELEPNPFDNEDSESFDGEIVVVGPVGPNQAVGPWFKFIKWANLRTEHCINLRYKITENVDGFTLDTPSAYDLPLLLM